MDAILRLFEGKVLRILKWNGRSVVEYTGSEVGFFKGTFYLKHTPHTKRCLEQIEEPPEPERRRIGF